MNRPLDLGDDVKAMFCAATGAHLPVEILSRVGWTAGHCLVAEKFHRGRVFIGGDAGHLFTPTGGLGYKTAVEDAVNLGWKLAAVLRASADERLLDSYEQERRPLAVRNTNYARRFADSIGLFEPDACIEDPGSDGEAARARAGAYLAEHGRSEFNIPGITFGGRYDGPVRSCPTARARRPMRPTVRAYRISLRSRAASLARRRPIAVPPASASNGRSCN